MSLLEKAIRGYEAGSSHDRTSLFSRAIAAREPLAEQGPMFDTKGFEELEGRLGRLARCQDSILAFWSYVSELLPLAAIALFLPRGDFLVPAALNGFPCRTKDGVDGIPMSLALSLQKGVEALGNEAKALLAPILGVPLSLSLRAAATRPESSFVGLWVYHDPILDVSSAEIQAKLKALLARSGATFPELSIATTVSDPVRVLAAAARKFHSALAFSFDLSSFNTEDPRFRGLETIALRSAFIAACGRILSQGGTTIAYGEQSVACVLGSGSAIDPDLALFQFAKTLRRILPFLAVSSFPEGRALGFDPSSERDLKNLSRFLFH